MPPKITLAMAKVRFHALYAESDSKRTGERDSRISENEYITVTWLEGFREDLRYECLVSHQ